MCFNTMQHDIPSDTKCLSNETQKRIDIIPKIDILQNGVYQAN